MNIPIKKWYDSMSYRDLCAMAAKKGIRFKIVPFRGIEDDPQLNAARESLISKLK